MQINGKQFTSSDLVQIAKRINNIKRPYLLVNPYQGKHVPVTPSIALNLYQCLKEKIECVVNKEDILVIIAFAETATAIGSGIACRLENKVYYLQTTREHIENADYIFFSETHSHAAEQKIVNNNLEPILDKADKIIFVEDEVTTGNTICHLIQQLETYYPQKSHSYSIASIINGMNKETEQSFYNKEIDLIYLTKSDNEKYSEYVSNLVSDDKHIDLGFCNNLSDIKFFYIDGYINPRKITCCENYKKNCNILKEKVAEMITLENNSDILVLGTEEFMYPALLAANRIEDMEHCRSIKFHATTRSPIMTSTQDGYPLQTRYELISLYDANRTTYIYNLKKYDQVIILTDAAIQQNVGLKTLLSAVESVGNKNISVFEWRN